MSNYMSRYVFGLGLYMNRGCLLCSARILRRKISEVAPPPEFLPLHSLINLHEVFIPYTCGVTDGPDAVSVSPPNTSYTVDEGGFLANIVCNADCHPACTYVWRKKDQVSIVSSNKTLSLGMNIRRTYAGTYACTASRSDGFGAQSTVFVHLNVRCKFQF